VPSPDRAEILRRAKEAFREHGRGFVVVVEDREEPHYGFLDELQKLLGDEPDARGHGSRYAPGAGSSYRRSPAGGFGAWGTVLRGCGASIHAGTAG
jgi:hypothetical protein